MQLDKIFVVTTPDGKQHECFNREDAAEWLNAHGGTVRDISPSHDSNPTAPKGALADAPAAAMGADGRRIQNKESCAAPAHAS